MLTLLVVYTNTSKLKELLIAPPAHIAMHKQRQMKPTEKMRFFDLPDDKQKMEEIAKMMRDGSKTIKEFVDKEMNP